MRYIILVVLAALVIFFVFNEEEEPIKIPLIGMGSDTEAERAWKANQRKEYLDSYIFLYRHGFHSSLTVVREAESACRGVYVGDRGGSSLQTALIGPYTPRKREELVANCRIFSLAIKKIKDFAPIWGKLNNVERTERPVFYFDWVSGKIGGKNFSESGPKLGIGPFKNRSDCREISRMAASHGHHVTYCYEYSDMEKSIYLSPPPDENPRWIAIALCAEGHTCSEEDLKR